MIFRTKRGAGGYQAQAQMIFRTKRGAGRFQDGLLGGIQLARTSRRRPLSGADDMPGQGGAGRKWPDCGQGAFYQYVMLINP